MARPYSTPPLACDAHAHVFALSEKHPHSTFEDYTRMHEALGITRGVLTQPSPLGTDNSLLLDALAKGAPHLRGIVSVEVADLTDKEIARLTGLGVSGIRINCFAKVGPQADDLEAVADRIGPAGWHVEIVARTTADYIALAPRLQKLACPAAFDMFGHVTVAGGTSDPLYRELTAMLRDGVMWQKLSHSDRISKVGPPFPDVLELMRGFIAANPARCIWGTDWPHDSAPWTIPDDGVLLDRFAECAGNEATFKRILVDNPAELHGF